MNLDFPSIALLLGSIASVITSVATLIVATRTRDKVETVHKEMNSMKDALVAVTRSDALQEGYTAGVAEQKAADPAKGKA